jgi:hypothetical protein
VLAMSEAAMVSALRPAKDPQKQAKQAQQAAEQAKQAAEQDKQAAEQASKAEEKATKQATKAAHQIYEIINKAPRKELLAELTEAFLEADASVKTMRGFAYWDGWGTSVTLMLKVDEKSALSPGATLNTVWPNALTPFQNGTVTTAQSYSTGFGFTASSDATRTDKLHAFYLMDSLLYPEPRVITEPDDLKSDQGAKPDQAESPEGKEDDKATPDPRTWLRQALHFLKRGRRDRPRELSCLSGQANGDVFLQSDLKLREWFQIAARPQYTGIANYQAVKGVTDVISHEVMFEIVSSGNVTPSWKLVQATVNASSPMFNTTRDRTQDLIITMGPTQGDKGSQTLAGPGQNSQLASEIGVAVAQAIKASQ